MQKFTIYGTRGGGGGCNPRFLYLPILSMWLVHVTPVHIQSFTRVAVHGMKCFLHISITHTPPTTHSIHKGIHILNNPNAFYTKQLRSCGFIELNFTTCILVCHSADHPGQLLKIRRCILVEFFSFSLRF